MSCSSSITRKVEVIPTSELIVEVEKYRELWDQNLDEHQDKGARSEAWTKVMVAFFPDLNEMSPVEKMDIETAVRRKWKSIRTCYSRELLKIKSGEDAGRRRQYQYFELLRFLDRGAKTKPGGENESEENSATATATLNSRTASPSTSQFIRPSRTSQVTVTPAPDHTITSSETNEKTESKREEKESFPMIPRPSIHRNRVFKRPRQETKLPDVPKRKPHGGCGDTGNFSADKMFLMSLVPDLQKVDETIKLKVKLDIMKVIMNAQEKSVRYVQNSFTGTHDQLLEFEDENFPISQIVSLNNHPDNSLISDETTNELSFIKVEALENLSSVEDPEDSMDYDDIFLV